MDIYWEKDDKLKICTILELILLLIGQNEKSRMGLRVLHNKLVYA